MAAVLAHSADRSTVHSYPWLETLAQAHPSGKKLSHLSSRWISHPPPFNQSVKAMNGINFEPGPGPAAIELRRKAAGRQRTVSVALPQPARHPESAGNAARPGVHSGLCPCLEFYSSVS